MIGIFAFKMYLNKAISFKIIAIKYGWNLNKKNSFFFQPRNDTEEIEIKEKGISYVIIENMYN